MALIVISVDRDKLPEHTDEEFKEWIEFEVRHMGYIPLSNPLYDIDLEAEVKEIG